MTGKIIAILTSGGDSPGMNPAVRAVALTAARQRVRVFGISNGYQGIFDDDFSKFNPRAPFLLLLLLLFLHVAACHPEGFTKGR